MIGYILITVIFSVTVLLFCWILLSYLYHATGGLTERDLHKLRFKSKVAFALTSFWKRISEAKILPQESIKKGAGRITNKDSVSRHETANIKEFREKKEREAAKSQKRYKIKENM